MPQTPRQKIIQISLRRKFKVGDPVFLISHESGYNGNRVVVSGNVTKVYSKIFPNYQLDGTKKPASRDLVDVKFTDKARKFTGIIGHEGGNVALYIKATQENKNHQFQNVHGHLIDLHDLETERKNRKKLKVKKIAS